MMNNIQTWCQGSFIDGTQYNHIPVEQKNIWNKEEQRKVRPGPKENAICFCPSPSNARWIASRLNLASKLEELIYDFSVGRIDGEKIIEFVKKH